MKNHRYNIFAFGSLTDLAFVRKLLKKKVNSEPAKLVNYKKVHIRGRKYPLAIKKADSEIQGKLLVGLTEDDLAKIDEWEKTPENYYRKTKIKVKTKRGLKEAIAFTTSSSSIKGETIE